MSANFRVLLVDDDATFLSLIERALRSQGMDVTVTSTALGVSNLVRRVEPNVVLLDVNLPALSGDAVLAVARRSAPAHTRFVLFSSSDESTLRELAQRVGADGYITKSVDPFKLGTILRALPLRPRPPGS
jgi:DNA-binding response OmpR family regulator